LQLEIVLKYPFICQGASTSGVARVPCALGQEIFLRPPSTKIIEFELKNRCESAEEAKAEYLL